jgi:hypothetical protein
MKNVPTYKRAVHVLIFHTLNFQVTFERVISYFLLLVKNYRASKKLRIPEAECGKIDNYFTERIAVAVSLLARILEVLGSNLCRYTAYTLWFLHFPQINASIIQFLSRLIAYFHYINYLINYNFLTYD